MGTTTTELCFGKLCCKFKYSVSFDDSITNYYRYAMAVYHGNRTFDGFADGGVVACAVITCANSSISSCGRRDETLGFAHQWNSLEISGEFPGGDQFFYLPTSLDESVMPFGVDEFEYKQAPVVISK